MSSFSGGAIRTTTRSREPATVLVVDDSELMRALISDIINSSGTFRVVGQAGTGYQAIRLVHDLKPDVVTLDLEMPDLRGVDALAYIMSEAPRPVIIVSGHSAAMADPMLRAIDYGALEFVAKPHGDEPRDVDVLRRRLLVALAAAADAKIANLKRGRAARAKARAQRAAARAARMEGVGSGAAAAARCVIAVAASTGGPRALVDLIPRLPAELPAAVLVVQHMPSVFTRLLAQRLDSLSNLPVKEAHAGDVIREGTVYLAPGGLHMGVRRAGDAFAIALEEGDPIWGVRPAADILFGAVARHFGPRSLGVVLTGMGRDGAAGLRAIREVGGWTAVQDASSAVIQSMPRAASPFASVELPLEQLARAVCDRAAEHARAARTNGTG
jgi:two-component system chemotaxis response regulator CheB